MSSASSGLNFTPPGNLTTKGGIKNALGSLYGNTNQLIGQTQGQRQGESGTLLPQYQGLVSNGGYTPEQKASISQSTLGGIQGGYNSAADQQQRQSAVTNNAAGNGSVLGSLARSKARDLGQAGLQIQSQFANQAYQQKMAGLQGLSQMYGVDTGFLNSLNQNQNSLLGVGNSVQSRSRGVLGTLGAGIGLAGQALSL